MGNSQEKDCRKLDRRSTRKQQRNEKGREVTEGERLSGGKCPWNMESKWVVHFTVLKAGSCFIQFSDLAVLKKIVVGLIYF